MMDRNDMAVAVLAGGAGSRIGGDKPLIRLGETSLLRRAIDRASRWSDNVVIAARSEMQLGKHGPPVIEDVVGIDGPLAGLAAALEWTRRQGLQSLLTLPCDMPFLPDNLPSRLRHNIGAYAAALASSGGYLHPVCGLWRHDVLGQLSDYCASGKRSLRGFAEHVGFVEVSWPLGGPDPFFNINSPADLEIARKMLDD